MTPTAVICLNEDLQMPVMDVRSDAPPSMFAYPPMTEPPKEKSKEKVETAVLSITNKVQARNRANAEEKNNASDTSSSAEGGGTVEEKSTSKKGKSATPEPNYEMLANPARVVAPQLEKIALPPVTRYTSSRPGEKLRLGVNVLKDNTPEEPQEYL